MTKLKEDNGYVWYNFETDISGDLYIDARGRHLYKVIIIHGLFKFHKSEYSLEFDIDKTDPYILTHQNNYKMGCFMRMIDCARKNCFPEKVSYQTG